MKKVNYLTKDRIIALVMIISLSLGLVAQALMTSAYADNTNAGKNNQVLTGTSHDGEDAHFVNPEDVKYLTFDGTDFVSATDLSGAEIEKYVPSTASLSEYKNDFNTHNWTSQGVPEVEVNPVVTTEKTAAQATDTNGNFIENEFDITLEVTSTHKAESLSIAQSSAIALAIDISGSMQNDSSNTDKTGDKSFIPDIIHSTVDFITEYGASGNPEIGAHRYISITTYGRYADAMSVNGQYWFDVADPDARDIAIEMMSSLQARKTIKSSTQGNVASEYQYLIRYNSNGTIKEVICGSEEVKNYLEPLFPEGTIIIFDDNSFALVEASKNEMTEFTVGHHGETYGYTFTQGGLYVAASLLEDAPVDENLDLVLLLDGDGYIVNDAFDGSTQPDGFSYKDTSSLNDDSDFDSYTASAADQKMITDALNYIEDELKATTRSLIYETYSDYAYVKEGSTYTFYISKNNTSSADDHFNELFDALESVGSSIVTGADLWTVTDPMAEGFSIIEYNDNVATKTDANGTETLKWDLKKEVPVENSEGNVTTYTYTYTYRVKMDTTKMVLDADDRETDVKFFLENNFYPTNGKTFLTYEIPYKSTDNGVETTIIFGAEGYLYNGVHYRYDTSTTINKPYEMPTADFNVPTVEPLYSSLEFTKVDATSEATLPNVGFTVKSLAANDEFTVYSDKDGLVSLSGLPNGDYEIKETDKPADSIDSDGNRIVYVLDENTYGFSVAYGEVVEDADMNVGVLSLLNALGNAAQFPNERQEDSIERYVQKSWFDVNGIPMDLAPANVTEVTFGLYNANDVTITLDADGKEISRTVNENAVPVATATTNANNHWYAQFVAEDGKTQFPSRDADGNWINYVVVEMATNGKYTVTYSVASLRKDTSSGTEKEYYLYEVTNKLTNEQIDIPVYKNWVVPMDDDGEYLVDVPDITVTLTRIAKGAATAEVWPEELTLTAENNYRGTFEDLDKYDENMQPYTYTITENTPENFNYEVVYVQQSFDMGVETDVSASTDGFYISNVLKKGDTNIQGVKTWSIPEGVTVTKPNITVTITNSLGDTVETLSLPLADNHEHFNGQDGYAYKLTDLPAYVWKNVDGDVTNVASEVATVEALTYSATETIDATTVGYDESLWYAPETGGTASVENIYSGSVEVIINKDWNNIEGVEVTYTLLENDAETNISETITGEFTDYVLARNLPKYDMNGALIRYDVKETIKDASEEYTYFMESKTHAIDADGNTTVSFVNNSANQEPDTIEIKVEKAWEKPADIEATDVEVTLYRMTDNGWNEIDDTTLNAANSWMDSFTGLPKTELVKTEVATGEFEEDGTTPVMETVTTEVTIEYKVEETSGVGTEYTTTYARYEGGNLVEGDNLDISEDVLIKITNTRNNTETVDLTVNKTWSYEGIPADIDTITFKVYNKADMTTLVASKDVDVNLNGNSVTFTGLPKYDANHNTIEYTITENFGDGSFNASVSTTTIGTDGNQTVDVTNNIIKTYSTFSAEKNWFKPTDVAAQDVVIELQRDGVTVDSITILAADANNQTSFIPEKDATGAYPFGYVEGKGWPDYDMDNSRAYVYTIVETTMLNGFTSTHSTAQAANPGENKVTNTYNIPQDLDLEATKIWVGPEENYNTAEYVVTFELYRYTDYAGTHELVETKSTDATTGKAEFTGLERYSAQTMDAYTYYVKEITDTFGYTEDLRDIENDATDRMTVTNRIDQRDIGIQVNKNWVLDGAEIPVDEVVMTVKLGGNDVDSDPIADGIQPTQLVLNAENNWEGYIDGLDMYDLNTGESLLEKYTIIEEGAESGDLLFFEVSYENTYHEEDGFIEFVVTNSFVEYQYEVIRHYRTRINGSTTHLPEVRMGVEYLTQAERDALTDETFVQENPEQFEDYDGRNYTFRASESTSGAAVELELPATAYEIHLYYSYTYESPDNSRPPDETPDTTTTPDIEIPDETTPLGTIPPENTPDIFIPEESTPLGTLPDEDGVIIADPEVPLGDLPQTGAEGYFKESNINQIIATIFGFTVAGWFVFDHYRRNKKAGSED